MSEYLSSFNDIFKNVVDCFGFKVRSIDGDVIFIIGDGYQLEFTMWRETVELRFCVVESNLEVSVYDIGNFISTYVTDEDRAIDDTIIPKEGTIVYIRNVTILGYFNNALRNHFPSMLAGNMDWLDLYEKSAWYNQPRIEKRQV